MFKTDAGIGLHIAPLGVNFWAILSPNLEILIKHVLFSLQSILSGHLNHSNRIRNEQVMAKIRKLVKTGKPEQVLPVEPYVVPVELGQK